ncbi:DYW_deaminase domain-containing protein [Psidium guajava]|nr:DYW_deaminase domain-containing protein [Psidium guajava]
MSVTGWRARRCHIPATSESASLPGNSDRHVENVKEGRKEEVERRSRPPTYTVLLRRRSLLPLFFIFCFSFCFKKNLGLKTGPTATPRVKSVDVQVAHMSSP